MDLELKTAVSPILEQLRADGHRLRVFVPELPDRIPFHGKPFSFSTACDRCLGVLVVRYADSRLLVSGSLLSADGCSSSSRQPAA